MTSGDEHDSPGALLGSGTGVSLGTTVGTARIIRLKQPDSDPRRYVARGYEQIENGDIIVTERFLPALADAAKRVAAIVTIAPAEERSQGLTSSGAIMTRELEIPGVVGCTDFRSEVDNEMVIYVDGDAGEVREVE